jgi:hypothetical protein
MEEVPKTKARENKLKAASTFHLAKKNELAEN